MLSLFARACVYMLILLVLSLGGGASAAEVYRQFRGRDPTPDALLRSTGLA